MTFSTIDIKPIFPTPFITASFPPEVGADLNRRLVPMLLDLSQKMPSARITNVGGWQSDTKIMEWGGEPVRFIANALQDLIKQVTMDLHNRDFDLTVNWKIYGWANINRKGNFNTIHTHAGAYWSAIYYVQTGEKDEKAAGGELEILDPRGTLPVMYCPQLRLRGKEFLSCGGYELHQPKAGQCLLFPSWLPHSVRPYEGDGMRISLAFNFSV